MTGLIHISMSLGLLFCGAGGGSTEFVRVERLSDRVVIAYRLGTGAIVYLRGHLPGISERAELKDVHRYIEVHKRFRHFFQKQSAEWSKAKQDRNIRVLWHLLKETDLQPQTEGKKE